MHIRPALLALAFIVMGLQAGLHANAAPGPNARPPLPTIANVLSIAMSDDGTILATTDDPGSSAPTPGNPGAGIQTWYLWSPTGALLQTGNGDLLTCGSRLQDMCQSPVPAAAIAATGARFAFGSNVADSVVDNIRGQLSIGNSQGIVARVMLNAPGPTDGLSVVAVAMDHAGDSVAVLERITHVNAPDTGQIEWFDITAANAVTAVRPAYPLAGPPLGMALADDGSRLAAVADRVYVFLHDTSLPAIVGTGTPQAVALAAGGAHGIFWGTASGDVHFLTDGSPNPRFSGNFGTSAVSAVAQSRNGRWGAAGNAVGLVRVYALDDDSHPWATPGAQALLPDAVRQLALTPDGQHLLVRSASQVRLYHNAQNLTLLWTDQPGTAPVGLGLTSSAHLAATAVANGIVVYPAVRGIRADAVTETMLPGASRTIELVYRNDGNRPEEAAVEAWFPAGWFVSITPNNLTVPVGGSANVSMRIVLPTQVEPKRHSILLNHTLASTGARVTSPVFVDVSPRDLVVLGATGPTSLAIRGGQTVEFQVQVENRGNRPGVGHLSMEATPATWQAALSRISVELAPGEVADVTVSLTAPMGVVEGDVGHVRLVLAERPQDPLDLWGTVGARFRVSMPPVAPAAVQPGNTTTVALSVKNEGNVVDSIALSAGTLPPGWNVQFTAGNDTLRDLPAGESATAFFLVTAPADAPVGLQMRFEVQAASQGNPASTAERTVTVTVTSDGKAPPFVPDSGNVPWPLIGAVGLALVAVGGAVGGYFLMRRK